MIRANRMRLTYLQQGEVAISTKRLADLERIERAHSAYLEAAQKMRGRLVEMEQMSQSRHDRGLYGLGWLACLRQFSEAVLDAARRQENAA
jgi:hypothetical protein